MNPTETAPATRSVVIERQLPHAPAKVWRALTEKELIAEWLMPNDFEPKVGHHFTLKQKPVPNWDGVINCEVLKLDPPSKLAYSWTTMGMRLEVHITLTPAGSGTQLRMEQTGFPATGGEQYIGGAQYGWNLFLGNLEKQLGTAA